MSDHSTAIFKLMKEVCDGDRQAQQQLRQMANRFFSFAGFDRYLFTVQCEIWNVQRCFVATGSRSISFFIPATFELENVQLDGDVYSFLAKDGRTQAATLTQLNRTWDLLPWGGDRVTAEHVERAFLGCHRENQTDDVACPPIGIFRFEGHCFCALECTSQDRLFSIFVHAGTADDFSRCVAPMLECFNTISTFDELARIEFTKKFGVTEEDLDSIALDQLDIYIDGEFDLTYRLPEEEAVEYVRACFSSNGNLVEVGFGNY